MRHEYRAYLLYAERTANRPFPLPSQTVFPTTAALKTSVLRSWHQINLAVDRQWAVQGWIESGRMI